MIDTLVKLLGKAREPMIPGRQEKFVLVTLHRPSNVDDPVMLGQLLATLNRISESIQVVFPIHPRTRRRLEQYNLAAVGSNLLLTDPFGYLEFLWLQQHASVVVTDSGGIQEETTYLQIPCLTMRENTERPVTVEIGTNILVGGDTARLSQEVESILEGRAKKGAIPPLWDGKAGLRIARILDGLLPLQ